MNKTEKEKLVSVAKEIWGLAEIEEAISKAFDDETRHYYKGKELAYKDAARKILKAIEEIENEKEAE